MLGYAYTAYAWSAPSTFMLTTISAEFGPIPETSTDWTTPVTFCGATNLLGNINPLCSQHPSVLRPVNLATKGLSLAPDAEHYCNGFPTTL